MSNKERIKQKAIEHLRSLGILDDDRTDFILLANGQRFELVGVVSDFIPEKWTAVDECLPIENCLVYIGHEFGECSGRFSVSRQVFEWINPLNPKTTWHPENGDSNKWVKFPIPVKWWHPYFPNEGEAADEATS
jgi:hypothetical protein